MSLSVLEGACKQVKQMPWGLEARTHAIGDTACQLVKRLMQFVQLYPCITVRTTACRNPQQPKAAYAGPVIANHDETSRLPCQHQAMKDREQQVEVTVL
jgi:hypothetical protein